MVQLLPALCVCFCLLSVRAAPEKTGVKARVHDGKLSDQEHYHQDGKHNTEYDHEAFLGKEKKSFDQLTPEESKERLGKIVDKVDKDDDGKITSQQLKDWIKLTQMQHHLEVATKRWEDMKEREIKLVSRSDFKGDKSLDPKGPVTWDRYKKIHYGANPEQHEDAERLLKQIKMDERRWKEADRDQDGTLSKDEYPAFYQPWEYDYMHGVAAQENLEDIDTDKDGRVSLEEYLATVHRKSESEMTEDELEQKEADKDYFHSSRDANKDGYLDLDEVKEWMFPTNYDYLESEVSHLIYHADTNKDEHLTKDEVLDNYDLFVGSRATNYGTDLTRHDEF